MMRARIWQACAVGAVVVIACLLARWITCSRQRGKPMSAPGSDLFAINVDVVKTVIYTSSSGQSVAAMRAKSRPPAFVLTVYDAGGTVSETCRAGTAFKSVLAAVSHIRIVREMDDEECRRLRASPSRLEHILIRDSVLESDPSEWDVLSNIGEQRPVILLDSSGGWEVDLPKSAIGALQGGCKGIEGAPTHMGDPDGG